MGTIQSPRIIPVGAEPPSRCPRRPDTAGARCQTTPNDKAKGKRGKAPPRVAERFRTLNKFVDRTMATLTRAEALVWFVLYRHTRDGTAKVGTAELARRAGCSRISASRALKRLRQLGLVETVYQGGFHKGVSRYKVTPTLKVPNGPA